MHRIATKSEAEMMVLRTSSARAANTWRYRTEGTLNPLGPQPPVQTKKQNGKKHDLRLVLAVRVDTQQLQ